MGVWGIERNETSNKSRRSFDVAGIAYEIITKSMMNVQCIDRCEKIVFPSVLILVVVV
jgi:hypothetical protein